MTLSALSSVRIQLPDERVAHSKFIEIWMLRSNARAGHISNRIAHLIRLLIAHLRLSVDDASALVNRCVLDAERVTFTAPSRLAAEALLTALRDTPAAPRISAVIAE